MTQETTKIDSKEFSRWAFRHILWAQRMRQLINSDMTVIQCQILLLVAREPGISSRDIIQTLDIHPAALSRNMKTLSEWYDVDKKTGKEVKKGYDLIDPRVNRRERRAKDYFLTKKGREVIDTLWKHMQNLAIDGKKAEGNITTAPEIG